MPVIKRKPIVLRKPVVADMKDFDWEIYLLNYPELVEKGIRTKPDACDHYKKIGFWEKRSCKIPPQFNAGIYLKANSHLGLRNNRDAYIHYMRIGSMIKKNEGFKRGTQAYRMPLASQYRKPSDNNKTFIKQEPAPTIPISPIPQQRRNAQPFIVRQALSNPRRPQQSSKQSASLIRSLQTKHIVKQPKPGQLVLREPPSVYFARMCKLGPPRYLN